MEKEFEAAFKLLNKNIESLRNDTNKRLDKIEGRLDTIEGRLDTIEGRLDTIEKHTQELHAKTFRHTQDIKGIKQRH